jgi:hypothetical protein
MRLNNTETLEVEIFFHDTPEYAIFSHTSGDDEVTFEEMKSGGQVVGRIDPLISESQHNNLSGLRVIATSGTIPATLISRVGCRPELSESTKSILQWYKSPSICYVYLEDTYGPPAHQKQI